MSAVLHSYELTKNQLTTNRVVQRRCGLFEHQDTRTVVVQAGVLGQTYVHLLHVQFHSSVSMLESVVFV